MQFESRPATTIVDFSVRVLRQGRRPVVAVRGEVDRETVALFTAALATAIDSASSIEVDLGDTTFMDSSGVRALFAAHLRLGQLPEAIVLREPPPSLHRLVALAGIEGLFTFEAQADDDIAG